VLEGSVQKASDEVRGQKELQELRSPHEGSMIVPEQLIRIEAILGHRDEVERIAAEMRALRAVDKWTYPFADDNIACAYAIVGDADAAIPLLDRVLHQVYADSLTPAYLRFDPIYDAIRDDRRFQKLANEQL
jgi:hypothetical protein